MDYAIVVERERETIMLLSNGVWVYLSKLQDCVSKNFVMSLIMSA